ncbi:MAG: hypothetical protein R3321_06975, partial [Nitrososphaeraceae archaeon]|nr:hypothetical protein [Nitrososphaeraceae archaeon]
AKMKLFIVLFLVVLLVGCDSEPLPPEPEQPPIPEETAATPEDYGLGVFEEDPELAMCGTLVKMMNKDGVILETIDSKPISYEQILKEIPKKNVFTGSTIMVKTGIWKEFGGYRDFFNSLGYEDYDLTSRIVEKYKAINLNEALYFYRQYPESTSKKDLLYNPFKLHGYKLIQEFIQQRKQHGIDALDQNDIPFVINFIIALNKPYVNDQSLIYRELMWSFLNKSLFPHAVKNIKTALKLRPFNYQNWKALLLYILIRLKIIKE